MGACETLKWNTFIYRRIELHCIYILSLHSANHCYSYRSLVYLYKACIQLLYRGGLGKPLYRADFARPYVQRDYVRPLYKRGLMKPLGTSWSCYIERGLRKVPMQGALQSPWVLRIGPRGFMKPIYRGKFVKPLGVLRSLQGLHESPLYLGLQICHPRHLLYFRNYIKENILNIKKMLRDINNLYSGS